MRPGWAKTIWSTEVVHPGALLDVFCMGDGFLCRRGHWWDLPKRQPAQILFWPTLARPLLRTLFSASWRRVEKDQWLSLYCQFSRSLESLSIVMVSDQRLCRYSLVTSLFEVSVSIFYVLSGIYDASVCSILGVVSTETLVGLCCPRIRIVAPPLGPWSWTTLAKHCVFVVKVSDNSSPVARIFCIWLFVLRFWWCSLVWYGWWC